MNITQIKMTKKYSICKDTEQVVDRIEYLQQMAIILNRVCFLLAEELKNDPVPYTPYLSKSLGCYTRELEMVCEISEHIGLAAERL